MVSLIAFSSLGLRLGEIARKMPSTAFFQGGWGVPESSVLEEESRKMRSEVGAIDRCLCGPLGQLQEPWSGHGLVADPSLFALSPFTSQDFCSSIAGEGDSALPTPQNERVLRRSVAYCAQ